MLTRILALLLFASYVHAATPPNIVLIYADDLGYGDVSCYGATRIKTPHIDRLAEQGCGSRMRTPRVRPARRRGTRCLRASTPGGARARASCAATRR